MPTDSESDLQLEIGHVLLIDIVGYSKLLITEQREQLQALNEIVKNTAQFRGSDANGMLVRIPTGDGMALIFRDTVEAPLRCAVEVSEAIKTHPEIHLRMGIHSGPVSEVRDVNERTNIAGAGIDIAQRVMDCGDAGHILLSKHVADDLAPHPRWNRHLHDLGECEVKHGMQVSVVNFYDDQFGNAILPGKFQIVRKRRARARWAEVAIGLLVFAAIVAASVYLSRRPTRSALAIAGRSIAVLPFENLSRDPDNAYFAEGIKDEILTKLATVHDLKVISRSSTAKYQSKPDNLKSVAQELGVSTVLEGAVQKAGDKVRVNVQLIDAHADTHLWAKSYDRDLKDVLAVESEVSQEIADALRANLSSNESHVLASTGTRDAEAYDLFLRGEYEFHQADSRMDAAANDRADAFYRQALARDPRFAEAAAGLARSRLWRHWNISPLPPQELEEVKSIIDRALALAPNSPEAHWALGLLFYWGYRQYENALMEFNRTLELQPNSASAQQYRAYVYRRRGEWEHTLADLQRAQELDPRDVQIAYEIGGTYAALRLWKDAERAELRALAIDPHNVGAAESLLLVRLAATGDSDYARRTLNGFPEDIRSGFSGQRGYGGGGRSVVEIIGGWTVYVDVVQRHFTDAFQALEEKVANNDLEHLQQLAGRVILGVLAGQTDAAKSGAKEALPLLEARLRERPDDTFAMTGLCWVYLALGRNADALRLARQAADLISIEKDALNGPAFQVGLAQIEARAGAPEEAIKRLRRLLSIPGWVSIAWLKIDPVWDPIRNRPDFQQLLSGPEQIGPNK
jgi:TolB-like protein/Flp pilus assembly protein TadD